ncbi:MAG TPA: hypothetical protein VJ868_07185 [Actinomycetota bacterium]|jgi:hypothetical protein|nr:hypothetical protein [Actinomycetota bacterium]
MSRQEPAEATGANARPSSGRIAAIRVLAWVMAASAVGFGLFTAVFGIVSEAQRIHAFHNVVVASLLLIVSAPAAIAIARDPEHPTGPLMVLSAVAVAGALTMILSLTFDPFTAPFVILTGVLWALRPRTDRPFLPGRVSPILLVLVLAAAVPLVAYALTQAEISRLDRTSAHADFYHWVETSFFSAAVLLLGALAALRPADYRLAAWCGGGALAVVGLASLLLPGYASAMDAPWAWAALAGGIAFVAAAEWERRRMTLPRSS